MYIEHFSKNKKEKQEEKKISRFFEEKPIEKKIPEMPGGEKPSRHLKDALFSWQAPEFETTFRKDHRWYLYLSLVLVAIIGYAVYTNSPVMAITFILIGIVGYLYLQKEPQTLNFAITREGVVAGREIYLFENIQSFWVFYEPGEIKVVSLRNKKSFIPYVHIPIYDQDPVEMRRILIEYIPEVKQEPNVMDTLERIIGL